MMLWSRFSRRFKVAPLVVQLARSQEHLQQLRASADEATAAFQEHCCQASFQVPSAVCNALLISFKAAGF